MIDSVSVTPARQFDFPLFVRMIVVLVTRAKRGRPRIDVGRPMSTESGPASSGRIGWSAPSRTIGGGYRSGNQEPTSSVPPELLPNSAFFAGAKRAHRRNGWVGRPLLPSITRGAIFFFSVTCLLPGHSDGRPWSVSQQNHCFSFVCSELVNLCS